MNYGEIDQELLTYTIFFEILIRKIFGVASSSISNFKIFEHNLCYCFWANRVLVSNIRPVCLFDKIRVALYRHRALLNAVLQCRQTLYTRADELNENKKLINNKYMRTMVSKDNKKRQFD